MHFVKVYLQDWENEKEYVDDTRIKVDTGNNRLRDLIFYIKDGYPTIPLKAYGELWHKGWDIPTEWAVDLTGQSWISDAHTSTMEKCEAKKLVSRAEDYKDKVYLSKLLGLELLAEQFVRF